MSPETKIKSQISICSPEKLFYSRVRVYLTQNENFEKEPMLVAQCSLRIAQASSAAKRKLTENGQVNTCNHCNYTEEEEEQDSLAIREAILFKFEC